MDANNKGNTIEWNRVSTEEQALRYSLDAQHNECIEYASEHNLTIVKRFVSKSSGFKFDNPELQLLFDYIQDNNDDIDTIIYTESDRLMRDPQISGYIKYTCLNHNIKLIGINDQVVTENNESQELTDTIMMGVKKYEIERKNRRCIRGRDQKFLDGGHIGKPPYGYDTIIVNGRKNPTPNGDGFNVKNMFEDYMKMDNGKKLYGYLSLALKYQVFKKDTTKPMPLTVRNILHNPFYIGYVCKNNKESGEKSETNKI